MGVAGPAEIPQLRSLGAVREAERKQLNSAGCKPRLYLHINPRKEGTKPRLSRLPGFSSCCSAIYLKVFTGGEFQGGEQVPGSSLLPLAEGIRDFRGSLVTFAFLKPELLLLLLLTALLPTPRGQDWELCAVVGKLI